MKTIKNQNLLAAALTCALATTATVRADDSATIPATTPSTPATAPATAPASEPPMAAPDKAMDANGWRFETTIPLWLPQINGNATVRGHQANVNVNNAELRDHLDASFALAVEAHKGKFGLFGDVGYMKFSGGYPGPLGGQTDAQLKFLIANAGVSYELVKVGEETPFILEGTAGLRYWYAATELSHRDGSGTRDWSGGSNYNLYDPVIGLNMSQYFTKKLHLDISGDGGGFNVNNNTDWTWSVAGYLAYDFTKWFTLSAGYEALALDESNGSGTSEKGLNLIFSGVAVQAAFKF